MTRVNLDVELYRQPTNYYCVPACLKMVIEYAKRTLNVKIGRISLKRIAKAINANIDGTAFDDIENINELLENSNPLMEFKIKMPGNFTEIRNELDEGRPVIAWINIAEPPDEVWHSVVIKGYDIQRNIIIYMDPQFGEREEAIGTFLKKMEPYNLIVKLVIGSRVQRRLPELWGRLAGEDQDGP